MSTLRDPSTISLDELTVQSQLDKLARLQDQQTAISAEMDAQIAALWTPEQIEAREQIISDSQARIMPIAAEVTDLRTKIKRGALTLGRTVRGSVLMAVYVKGTVSYNTDAMDGFALREPNILAFRKEGEPSITIRS